MTSADDYIRILDHGTELKIGYDDCVKYHGRTSIGGVALGFRLLQHAFSGLCGTAIPDRAHVSVATAFPGPGFRDAVEMVTRAVTRKAYRVDPAAAVPEAPEAVAGRLYFEVGYDGRFLAFTLPPGAMSDEFITLGRRTHAKIQTAADTARWTVLKEALAQTIMSIDPASLLVPHPGLPALRTRPPV